jgi:hypothetical protein
VNPALLAFLGALDALALLAAALCEYAHRSGLRMTRAYAFVALVFIGDAFSALLVDQPVFAVNAAGLGLLFGWLWWRSGGGDGARRRLKAWAGRFRSARRTAPAAAL